ncbi:MAG: DUF5110 domain-containing protein [Burkholderiales bacterium]|nr:DUF5110 domain-containing protein [Phycisphaerae bacterium]
MIRFRSLFWAALSLIPLHAMAFQIGEQPAELVIRQVSPRTVCIEIAPLDDRGQPLPMPLSSVLVAPKGTETLRVRDLADQQVQCGDLTVSITATPFTVSVRRAGGKLVQQLAITARDGSITFQTPAPVFGLGGGRQQFDRRGFYYNFANGQNLLVATHGATVPVPFLIGADGWAMFIHNPSPETDPRQAVEPWGAFDLRGEDAGAPPKLPNPRDPGYAAALKNFLTPPDPRPTIGRYVPQAASVGAAPIQIYLTAWDQPSNAMEEFVRLTGQAVMPPKWVMGYMQSHRSLGGPDEVMQVADTLRDHQLPCDALIYLGTGYTIGATGWNLGHGSLEFNPRIFDKPQAMIDRLHLLNYKVILHKNAAPFALYGASVRDAGDDPLHIANYWATHLPLMKMGVDAWWPDDGDDLPIENRLARLRLYYEGPLKDRPNERPWSLNRNGYAGAARYGAWIWSGDVIGRWETLAAHVPVGLNFSMSVSPWWGTDIGGFFPSPEYTGELYTRWFQFAAFTPSFRSHGVNWHLHTPFGWNSGGVKIEESRPLPPDSELRNAQVEPICKQYLELRYRLLPYNYTTARQACDTGVPPMRALWLVYPQDEQATKIGDEYLWGDSILVAPVVEKGATTRKVYLPPGQWYDWWTGEKSAAGWVTRTVDLATMPLYVKAGAIIPLDPVRQYTSEPVTEPTRIEIYPGADGDFTLYDDDGHTLGYRDPTDASTIWIKMHWDDAARKLTIEPDARMKAMPTAARTFDIVIKDRKDARPLRVEFKGSKIEAGL